MLRWRGLSARFRSAGVCSGDPAKVSSTSPVPCIRVLMAVRARRNPPQRDSTGKEVIWLLAGARRASPQGPGATRHATEGDFTLRVEFHTLSACERTGVPNEPVPGT